MRLYTKHGDDGSTMLVGGRRVAKCDLRVAAYGDVDETNAAIGIVIAACRDEEDIAMLRRIQADLFLLGGELAAPDGVEECRRIDEAHSQRLEVWIDAATGKVPPLRSFTLPGGTEAAVAFHLARAVCRRAERAVVALAGAEPVRREVVVYLNRLSDLLFACARLANHRAGVAEIPWEVPKG